MVGGRMPAAAAAGARRSRRRRWLRAPRGRGSGRAAPAAIWRRLRQRTESQRRACSRSWVATTIAAALGGEVGDQRLEQLGAGAVEAGEGLVEEQDAGVLDEGAGDQRALALAAGELAEGLAPPACPRPTRSSAARAASRSRAARAAPPRQARERPHRRHVERRDRVVETGALGLRHGRAAGADPQLARQRAQLAEQRQQQRRLAAAVGAEQRQPLARRAARTRPPRSPAGPP